MKQVTHRFDNPEVVAFTRSVIRNWKPSGKPVMFVPCSKTKPIQESLTHKHIFRKFREHCDLLILSEPLTVIPYDRYDYPYYDYPPAALRKLPGEFELFRRRLTWFLRKNQLNRGVCYFMLPQHHHLILWHSWIDAFGDIDNLEGYGYTHATRWFFAQKMGQHLGIAEL